MPVQHKIKAQLYQNPFSTSHPDEFIARTISEESLSIRQICESAVSRGGADLPADTLVYATSVFLKEMAYQLCNGFAVNAEYFTAGTRVRGVFRSLTEPYDQERHSIYFHFNQGEKLRAQIPDIEVEILGLARDVSAIHSVTDVSSGSVNDVLTPGKNLRITGRKIKIAGDSPQNGILFLNTITGESVRVSPNDIVVNSASELIIFTPQLPKGSHQLLIVTQYSGSNLLKMPKTFQYSRILTVE